MTGKWKKGWALICAVLGLTLFGGLTMRTAEAAAPTVVSFANITVGAPYSAATVYYKPDPADNMRLVAGTDSDYTVSYRYDATRQAGVLTMKNATLATSAAAVSAGKAALYVEGGNLILQLIGTNIIGFPLNLVATGGASHGIRAANCALTIVGDSLADSLTVRSGKSDDSCGIYVNRKSLTIDHCTVDASAGELSRLAQGIGCFGSSLQVQNGAAVTANGSDGHGSGFRTFGLNFTASVTITGASRVTATGNKAGSSIGNNSCGVQGSASSASLTVNGASTLIADGGIGESSCKGIDVESVTITDSSTVIASGGNVTSSVSGTISYGLATGKALTLSGSTLTARSGTALTSRALYMDNMAHPILTFANGYQWRVDAGGKWVDSRTSTAPTDGWFAPTYLDIRPNPASAPTPTPAPTASPNPPPQTGDTAAPLLWLGLLLIAGATLLRFFKRRQSH